MDRPRKDKSLERLHAALKAIANLKELDSRTSSFVKWRRDTEVAIANTFGSESRHVQDFTQIRFSRIPQSYVRSLESAASVLESMIDEIKEYWVDDQPTRVPSTWTSGKEPTNEVFVVHGRDDGSKETVARFLTKLGLNPIVLHEQPNQGRTIIDKFEQYAQVSFAVVLLTPDDSGAPRDQPGASQPRAGQNVILELGFFLGRLGRHRTCVLRKEDVEIPSDYDGVIYIPMDNQDAWRMKLIRELKGSGFDVDANLAV